MTIRRERMESARAISTICCSATERSRTRRHRVDVEPDALRDARASPPPCAPVDEEPRARLAADEDVLGDRHVRGERELLVDRDDAELSARRAGSRQRHRLAGEVDRAGDPAAARRRGS